MTTIKFGKNNVEADDGKRGMFRVLSSFVYVSFKPLHKRVSFETPIDDRKLVREYEEGRNRR